MSESNHATPRPKKSPIWAALAGSCPDCGRILANVEGSQVCLACGYEPIGADSTSNPLQQRSETL